MKMNLSLLKLEIVICTLLMNQVYAATPFSPEYQPLGVIGAMELSSTDISTGAKGYRGWYENGAWQGDLVEYTVSSSGGLSTSIDSTGLSPAQGISSTNWSSYVTFAGKETADASYWNTGRKIITKNGTGQVSFVWSSLNDTQKQALDLTAFDNNDASSGMLDFIRGDRSNESPTGSYRLRFSMLGDIIHSNPVYVGKPDDGNVDSSYVAFVNNNASRDARIYIGANDGMLHAFDASNGEEAWAYIPSMLIGDLPRLGARPYTHTYFVDGGLTVQDGYFDSTWHSVLVGSLGAGGKGLFALDVTHPALSSESATMGNDKKVLWEISADTDDDVGHIFGRTTLAKMNDGKWYAVNGNGVSSVNGIATLFLVDLKTGLVTEISTASGSSASPNGLAAPALVDTDIDGMVDIAYAGDIDGNMWKFDLTGSTTGSWKLDYKLYAGSSSQPITTVPDVTRHPQYGNLVLFGTGRLYTAADITDTSTQALYGIWDKGSTPGTVSHLTNILSADTVYTGGGQTETVRSFTTTAAINWTTQTGWKVELLNGERLLTPPQVRAGRLKTTITNPDGYLNWLLEVTFDEGGAESDTIFDLNRDGVLQTTDRVDQNLDGDLDDKGDIPMGWQRQSGNMSEVTMASISQGVDTLFMNYLNPPIVPNVCIGNCDGGLAGGHMDVDTDTTLGDSTDGHVHEYDDKYNVTYVDYFDIADGGLDEVDGIALSTTTEFIIVIANADLSPGSELTIGNKKISVVTYQRMIQEKLAGWNSTGPLVDDDGDSLIFTLNDLTANSGTLRSTFESVAISNGGLHPTQTSCVNSSSDLTNGRWRNGSLIIQLIRRDHFIAGTNALDRVTVQNPTDLKPFVILSDGTQVNLIEDLNNNGSIDTGSPDYEAYGGIIASNDAEFIYESTLFWHFGDISKIILGTKPCYGETGWEDAYRVSVEGLYQSEIDILLADLGFNDIDELASAVELLRSCKDDDKKCLELYEELLMFLDLVTRDPDAVDNGSIGDIPPEFSRDEESPVTITGGVSEGGVTSGPNFEAGRRTWIDIVPE